jgi:hypothetical protein
LQSGAVAAHGTLTLTTNPSDADTMTIGGKVYTFRPALTDADSNIAIGATLTATRQNATSSNRPDPVVDAALTGGSDGMTSA